MTFHDLASLAKPLVTAPLALAFLDLDADRRWALGFHDREAPLTVRMLLSHASGLPAWRPFTGEPLAAQLRRPVPDHPLLRAGAPGEALYSDLNYRLLAELVARETAVDFRTLGAPASGLSPWPFPEGALLPAGPDAEAWALATDAPLPAPGPGLPHDLNARAGMAGHAGFGATAAQLRDSLGRWLRAWAPRMALEQASGADGSRWGLGLQRALPGPGRFGSLLPAGLTGIHVVEDLRETAPAPAPAVGPREDAGPWWFHLAFTGPALFVRPPAGGDPGACVALLCGRRGRSGALLDGEALRARRWALLADFAHTLA